MVVGWVLLYFFDNFAGTSVESGPQTPKHSPKTAMKRSSTVPFGPVTAVTPKQAKISIQASPSPSIKMWLKRSASAPVSNSSVSNSNQNNPFTSDSNGVERPVDNQSSNISAITNETDSCSAAKKSKTETVDSVKENRLAENSAINEETETKDTQKTGKPIIRKSCKRKLVDDDESPGRCKKQRVSSDTVKDFNVIKEDKENTPSPEKVVKDSKCDMSKSPVMRQVVLSDMFQSPARMSLKELDSNIYQSPTANLPNLVVDGPQIKVQQTEIDEDKKKTVDWLTQMRIQKLARHSPQSKKCRGKLLDKLTDSSGTESSQEIEKTITASPKVKVIM